MIAVNSGKRNIFAKAVKHFLLQLNITFKRNLTFVARKHIKTFWHIIVFVKLIFIRAYFAEMTWRLVKNFKLFHSVDTKIHKIIVFLIITDKVIMVVLPNKSIRRDGKRFFSMFFTVLHVNATPAINEFNLFFISNCVIKAVDNNINFFIIAFSARSINIDLTFHCLCLFDRHKCFKLFNKRCRFFRSDKAGTWNSVDKKHYFRNFKSPWSHKKATFWTCYGNNITTDIIKSGNIGINRFSFAFNAFFLKHGN